MCVDLGDHLWEVRGEPALHPPRGPEARASPSRQEGRGSCGSDHRGQQKPRWPPRGSSPCRGPRRGAERPPRLSRAAVALTRVPVRHAARVRTSSQCERRASGSRTAGSGLLVRRRGRCRRAIDDSSARARLRGGRRAGEVRELVRDEGRAAAPPVRSSPGSCRLSDASRVPCSWGIARSDLCAQRGP